MPFPAAPVDSGVPPSGVSGAVPPSQGAQNPGAAGPEPKSTMDKKTGSDIKKDKDAATHPDDKERMKLSVALWLKRIKQAKERQKRDFDEMRESMKFAAGLQWPGQKKRNEGRYTANWTLRMVNAKVASLYSKNPTASFVRRKQLDFAMYDGKLENLIPLLQQASQHPAGLMSLPVQAKALIGDYMHGMQMREMIDKVGKTLEILFQHQLDEQDEDEGDFILQMKQLVRRTIVAKVGYVRVSYVRDQDAHISSSGLGNTVTTRALQIKHISEKVESGDLKRTSTQVEDLTRLATGLGGLMHDKQNAFGENERLVYDCIPSTNILIDPKCKALKGFIGAKWVVIEYCLPIEDVNAIFESEVKTNAQNQNTFSEQRQNPLAEKLPKGEETVRIYEVLDKQTRTHFYVAEGYDKYLAEPEYLEPNVKGFWHLGALTFNDIEPDVEGGQSIFPPSDVELVRDAQKETNRSREDLKKHRRANAPQWLTEKGLLSDDDREALNDGESHELIEIQNLPQGKRMSDVFTAKPQVPINPIVYDTTPQMQDATLTTGNPQESLGSTNQKTATGDQIQETNRMTVTSSNVDDVDQFLTWLASVSGQMILQGFSVETVKRIAGPGGVMPQLPTDRQRFLACGMLTTKAASSGRPNKTVDVNNWRALAPILQQAGANPQFMVRKTIEIMDSNIEPEEAFPLMPQQQQVPGQVSPSGGEHQPSEQGSHQPGHSGPPQQGRPGPGVGAGGPGQRQHPQHQLPAHSGSVVNQLH